MRARARVFVSDAVRVTGALVFAEGLPYVVDDVILSGFAPNWLHVHIEQENRDIACRAWGVCVTGFTCT